MRVDLRAGGRGEFHRFDSCVSCLCWERTPLDGGCNCLVPGGLVGVGTLFFNFLTFALVNPDNLSPDVLDPVDHKEYFDPLHDVPNRVPGAFLVSYCCLRGAQGLKYGRCGALNAWIDYRWTCIRIRLWSGVLGCSTQYHATRQL